MVLSTSASGGQLDERRDYYWLFTKDYKTKNPLLSLFTKCVRHSALIIQKVLHFKRHWDFELRKGCNWFTISNACLEYVISRKDFVMHNFRYIACVDEIFLQTLIWNSPFRDKIFNQENEYDSCMRDIDWSRGNPYIWKESDFPYLSTSKRFFCRKVSLDNRKLLDLLDRKIAKENTLKHSQS